MTNPDLEQFKPMAHVGYLRMFWGMIFPIWFIRERISLLGTYYPKVSSAEHAGITNAITMVH